jgi:nucleoside-diphosphate-sugar epimerase
MRVFVTGASGWIGSGVTAELVAAGHTVTGLARSEAAEASVRANGGVPVRGDLDALDVLDQAARDADAVIHCAFIHDFGNYEKSVVVDRRAIEALGGAIAGTGKLLLVTSGTAARAEGRAATELDAPRPDFPRLSEQTALGLDGVRASAVRLPQVHGREARGFVSGLIRIARDKGVSGYVGDGANRWSAVYRDDATRLYRLALEDGTPGRHYHAVADEGVPLRDIAALIGRKLGLPVRSIAPDQAAAHFGWLGEFAGMDLFTSSALTREWLGWTPTGPSLLDDLEHGTYFDACPAAA